MDLEKSISSANRNNLDMGHYLLLEMANLQFWTGRFEAEQIYSAFKTGMIIDTDVTTVLAFFSPTNFTSECRKFIPCLHDACVNISVMQRRKCVRCKMQPLITETAAFIGYVWNCTLEPLPKKTSRTDGKKKGRATTCVIIWRWEEPSILRIHRGWYRRHNS